jgi:hypothetical protein
MKLRNRRWVVCATLAVVVALCALALLSRRAPYRFLGASRYEMTEVHRGIGGPGQAYRYFSVPGTVESVTAMVAKELRNEDGWQLYRTGDTVQFSNAGIPTVVGVAPRAHVFGRRADEPRTVIIIVVEPATLSDRVLTRLQGR